MFLLIINVAHVLMTVNSSAGGVAAACWAPSWRTGCPLSFVEEGTRNKKAEGGTTQSVYFRGGGQGWGNQCDQIWCLCCMACQMFLRFL